MPYTGIVLSILSVIFGAFLILLCHWLTAAGLFIQSTDSFAAEYTRRPVRATLLGLVTFGPLLLLGLNAAKLPGIGAVLGLILGVGSLIIAFIGSAGLALRIGTGLCPAESRWTRALRGGVMLGLCFITPFLGWFVIAPLGLASGFGAFLLAKPWKSASSPHPAAAPALS